MESLNKKKKKKKRFTNSAAVSVSSSDSDSDHSKRKNLPPLLMKPIRHDTSESDLNMNGLTTTSRIKSRPRSEPSYHSAEEEKVEENDISIISHNLSNVQATVEY